MPQPEMPIMPPDGFAEGISYALETLRWLRGRDGLADANRDIDGVLARAVDVAGERRGSCAVPPALLPPYSEIAAERETPDITLWSGRYGGKLSAAAVLRLHRYRIFAEVDVERERQNAKYGFPQPLWQYPHILTSEVGEVGEECKYPDRPPGKLRTEILQVAAVCVQWVEALDAQEESSE